MARPDDATTKDLPESNPAAWMGCPGLHPRGPVEVTDADRSAVTADVDEAFRIVDLERSSIRVEMQPKVDARDDSPPPG